MGRPLTLDDLTAQRIVDAVKLGAPWYLAARAGGIGPSTLRDWKARGRKGEAPFAAFLARLEKAEAEGAVEALRHIREAGSKGAWQAWAWMLERRFPRSFGRRDRDRPRNAPNPLDLLGPVEDALFAALESHPEARAAVIAPMQDLARKNASKDG